MKSGNFLKAVDGDSAKADDRRIIKKNSPSKKLHGCR
jgi:hypothetical protein